MLCFSVKGIGQNMHQVIDASGGNATGTSGSASYSVGQIFYVYIANQSNNVTPGIQQGVKDGSLSTPDVEKPKSDVVAYPNPAKDFVYLNMNVSEYGNSRISYKLFDFAGRLLMQDVIKENETQVNLRGLRKSIYVLTVYVDNKVLKTFKIIKK